MRPESEEQLAEVVRGAQGALRIQGGGTRPVGRVIDGALLDVSGLSGISLYEPGALTLVAAAGTPMAEIEAALAAENQMLSFEPMDHRGLLGTTGEPTIGGVLAGNISGPRRVSAAGACRDSVLGVRFVDGTGQIVKNGGRVMKNVTGYDLSKLMCGAYGTLGVMTEVSLKVLPRPECAATLVLAGLDEARAVDALSTALKSPFEVTGAAYDPAQGALLRIEGLRASVEYRAGALSALLADFGAAEIVTDSDASAAIWAGVRDVAPLQDHHVVIRVSIKPSDMPGLVAALEASFPGRNNTRCFDVMADWGGGLVWIGATAAQLPDGGALLAALQGHCSAIGGHATLIKGSEALRRTVPSFQPEAAGVAALSAGLRQRFDPRAILNPGLME